MTGLMRIGGYLLLFFGVVWAASIVGGVFSRSEGFTDLLAMAPGYAFHVVTMVGGMALLVKASAAKRAGAPRTAQLKQS